MEWKYVSVVIGIAFGALLACEERVVQPVVVALNPSGMATAPATSGSACGPTVTPKCEGQCCPTAAACYPFGNPSPYSAAECLAERDNTDQPHWQFRQTMSVSTGPPGLAAAAIAALLVHSSELKSADCAASQGTGGFIQLIDLDRAAKRSRTGFASYANDLAATIAGGGLCFAEEPSYIDPMYALPSLYAPTADWPKGLPAPMPMPWRVGPTTAVRVDQDFVVALDRTAILARFDVGGDLYGNAGGIFYMNDATGVMHGFSPLTYIVTYTTGTVYSIVPIREAEITQRLNDPRHPNCSGMLLGASTDLPNSCVGDSTNRAWGCLAGTCSATERAPTRIDGYFLLAELEQVSALGQTLCVLFASESGYPGWTIPQNDLRCRANPNWNPMDPVKGLPRGDWCAAGNRAADDGCHDAWKSTSFSTFQAFPIRDGTCPVR
jgi:hypothetical protein